VAARSPRIDTLLLGCTHYPLIAPSIRRVAGDSVAVIDSAAATASALASLVEIHALGATADADVRHELYTTGDVERFRATAVRLFGPTVADVQPLLLADAPATAGAAS
jgi:glutamate racemase